MKAIENTGRDKCPWPWRCRWFLRYIKSANKQREQTLLSKLKTLCASKDTVDTAKTSQDGAKCSVSRHLTKLECPDVRGIFGSHGRKGKKTGGERGEEKLRRNGKERRRKRKRKEKEGPAGWLCEWRRLLPSLVNCIQSQDPHVRVVNLLLNLSFDLRSYMHLCACMHARTHAHKETQLRQLVFKADKGPQWAFSRRIYETANMMFNTVNYQRSGSKNRNG